MQIDQATLDDLPTERLEEEMRGLAGQLAAATCAFLILVGEYDAREAWREWEALSCAHWLNWRCGVGMVAAREQVRVARRLRELPRLREEFAAGRMSYSKARAISRVSDPAVVDHMIELSASATAAQVELMVSVIRREERQQALDDAEDEQLADAERVARWLRSLTWHVDVDSGDLIVRARIPAGVESETFQAAIEARTVKRPADGEELESFDCRRLDALVDLVADANAAGSGSLANQPEIVVHHHVEPVATPADRDANTNSSTASDTAATADQPQPTGQRQPTGARRPSIPWWHWHTDRGWRLSAAAFDALCCDAAIRARAELSTLDLGNLRVPDPADLGSPLKRVPTPALRRYVYDRDGGTCRFPGCSRRSGLHVHHIVWWSNGGLTEADNLVVLCRHHHAAVHERAWEMTGTASQLEVRRPNGAIVTPDPPLLHGAVGEFHAAFERHGPDITLDGASGRWVGDHIDLGCFSASVLNALDHPATRGDSAESSGGGVAADRTGSPRNVSDSCAHRRDSFMRSKQRAGTLSPDGAGGHT